MVAVLIKDIEFLDLDGTTVTLLAQTLINLDKIEGIARVDENETEYCFRIHRHEYTILDYSLSDISTLDLRTINPLFAKNVYINH